MATTQIAFGKVGYGGASVDVPALVWGSGNAVTSETITPSGSNQQTTITAPRIGERAVARIATDTAIYFALGASPDATTAASRVYLPAGGIEYVVCDAGDKVAVVTA